MYPRLLSIAVACALATGCAVQPGPAPHTSASEQPVLPVAATPAATETSAAAASIPAVEPEYQLPPADLWQRLRDGMTLTGKHQHPRLDKQLKWYANHQSHFDRVFERAEPYLYHITNAVEAKGLPLELALLPVVESAFDPFAYSHSHAAGLWQFIPGTASRFGLERNWWYEGRRDVVASTDAAIKYLTYLNKLFDGDWLLALAAYNSGEGTVRRAIKRNKRAGKPTDFWSLKLPRETRAYVPQLLAVSAIVQNPDAYKIQLGAMPNTPYFAAVDCGAQIDLAHAAKMADIPVDTLYKLNPAYNRWTTAPGDQHTLLLPIDKVEAFEQALRTTPRSQWVATREYVVQSGDTLSRIASKHNVSIADLRKENQLKRDLIRVGQIIKVPGSGGFSPLNGSANSYYRVASGDSLWDIARAHKVRVKDLRAWNNLAPKDHIQPGQQLQVSSRKPLTTNRKVKYRVKSGDSLARIASRFNVRVKDIVSWNKINPSKYLQPGQKLTLFIDIRRI